MMNALWCLRLLVNPPNLKENLNYLLLETIVEAFINQNNANGDTDDLKLWVSSVIKQTIKTAAHEESLNLTFKPSLWIEIA